MTGINYAIAILSFAYFVGIAAPAVAAESKSSIAVHAGQSLFAFDASEIDNVFPCQCFSKNTDSEVLDDSDSAWSITYEYRYTPNFGLEVGYVDFGESTFSHSENNYYGHGIGDQYSGVLSFGVSGLTLAAVGIIPIGNFELHGKLGVLAANNELSWSGASQAFCCTFINPNTVPEDVHQSTLTAEFLVGIGASYQFSKRFSLRADWTLIPTAGDDEVMGAGVVSGLTLGLQVHL